MRHITLSRCLLVASLIAIFTVECSANIVKSLVNKTMCAEYKKLGIPEESCINNENVESQKFVNHRSLDLIKNIIKGVANKVISAGAGVVLSIGGFARTLFDKPRPRTKLSRNVINNEPGFDLTKEEIDKFKLWENGVIPFFIDEYSFEKVLRDRIRAILDEVNSATGVQFMEIPRPPDDENTKYVFLINRRAVLQCVDHTTNDFTNRGVQKVVLGYDCIHIKAGMGGLILTLLGVPPQHNAPNRNSYIEVINSNILPDKFAFFKKLDNSEWLFHDLEYDFESASHYPYHKYSNSGSSTIRPKMHVNESDTVGKKRALSPYDIMKIKMLYNYISKHPTDRRHTACHDKFQPGIGFSKYQQSKNDVQPRAKPSKYLSTDPEGRKSEGATNEESTNNDESADNDENANNNKLK